MAYKCLSPEEAEFDLQRFSELDSRHNKNIPNPIFSDFLPNYYDPNQPRSIANYVDVLSEQVRNLNQPKTPVDRRPLGDFDSTNKSKSKPSNPGESLLHKTSRIPITEKLYKRLIPDKDKDKEIFASNPIDISSPRDSEPLRSRFERGKSHSTSSVRLSLSQSILQSPKALDKIHFAKQFKQYLCKHLSSKSNTDSLCRRN